MSVELDESACAMDAAPAYPILFLYKFNSMREELDVSACTMDAVTVSPI